MTIPVNRAEVARAVNELVRYTDQMEEVCGAHSPTVIRLRNFIGGEWLSMPPQKAAQWIEMLTEHAIQFDDTVPA